MSKNVTLAELDEDDQSLVGKALAASANAYAPYSGFAVGAAVRTKGGNVYVGANIENAAYAVVICAEVSAVAGANAAGDFNLEAIAVVGHKFRPPEDASQVVTPCGRCRQVIFEASEIADTDVRVLSCSGDLKEIRKSTISELLPDAFGPKTLGLAEVWPKMRAVLRATVEKLRAGVDFVLAK
jgi:cytidine deaminase